VDWVTYFLRLFTLLTLSSIISLFFFSMSCCRALSGDVSAGLAPASMGLDSDVWVSVDCHRREMWCEAVGWDGRSGLGLREEYGDDCN